MVKGALFTYVRPEQTDEPELLGVSLKAMKDLGLKLGEEQTSQFKALVAGNEIWWKEEQGGIYPWAQCYGGPYPRCRSMRNPKRLILRRVAIVSYERSLKRSSRYVNN
jgi:hypothetical protein